MSRPLPLSVDADDRERFERQNDPALAQAEIYRAHQPQTNAQKIISRATGQPIDQYQTDYERGQPELRSFEQRESLSPLFGSNGPAMSKGEIYDAHQPTNAREGIISRATNQPINQTRFDIDRDARSVSERISEGLHQAKETISDKMHHGGDQVRDEAPRQRYSADDRPVVERSTRDFRNKDETVVVSEETLHTPARRKSLTESIAEKLRNAKETVMGRHESWEKHDDSFAREFSTGNNSGPHPMPEPSRTPRADTMHDAHMHKGPVAIPTHASKYPVQDSTSIHPKHADLVRAIRESPVQPKREFVEPKDDSAAPGRIMGVLYSLHEKLEAGVQVLRDKADDFAENNLRSSPTPENEKKLADNNGNIPTLMDQYNQRNNHMVQAKSGITVHDHYPKGPKA